MQVDAMQFFTKADENLAAARLCFDNRLFNASVNRAYYAMLQAALAVLIAKGFPPKQKHIDHAWVQSTFAREIINRRKIFPSKFRSYLQDTQIFRNTADYEATLISAKIAKQQFAKSEEFVTLIKTEL